MTPLEEERLLMCVRRDGDHRGDEAEPVSLIVFGQAVVFTLDDGIQISFARDELDEALADSREAA